MSIDRSGFSLTPSTDEFTGFDIGITGDHAYIHNGKAFSAMGQTSLAAAGVYSLTLTTPAASVGYIHLRPAFFSSSTSYAKMSIIEAPTFTAGTASTPINRNRNSLTAPTAVYKYNAGYTTGGTVLDITTVGTGGNPTARAGGGVGADAEIVLKPVTTYLFYIENPTGGATSNITWNLFWYEELVG